MERWDVDKREDVIRPDVDLFLSELEELCRRHGLIVSHEDGHGAFIIRKLGDRPDAFEWLHEAMVGGADPA